ncbi:MAG: DUF2784 domain-containing protein [Pseudomonadota bacterium]|nr:DUF2784 domain-containing protein [Pseudomonadota bacterium]
MSTIYQIAADTVLVIHTGIVFFIVLGLILIVIGGFLQWEFVRHRWFRILHLSAIGVVVLQSWLGRLCPLTTLELWLREQAGGEGGYEESFVQYWLQEFLYYELPLTVFAIAYTIFGLAVVATWFLVPPTKRNKPV